MKFKTCVAFVGIFVGLTACGDAPTERSLEAVEGPGATQASPSLVSYSEEREICANQNPMRQAYFGDLHVHTSFSFDAFANGAKTFPEDAYRFAKGEAIPFLPLDENGQPTTTISIDRPLDFVGVTDHAEFLGEWAICTDSESLSYTTPFCQQYRAGGLNSVILFGQILTSETPARLEPICGPDGSRCREAAKSPWARIIAAAEAAYDTSSACAFTSFIAYEHTGTPGTSNFHRNVIFRNANVPDVPTSYIEAPSGPALWQALKNECLDRQGCDVIAIPHNTNLSNGRLVSPTPVGDMDPDAERALATLRAKTEPLMEVFQHKGNSECMNGFQGVLGAPDELCDFEQLRGLGRIKPVPDFKLVDGKPQITFGQQETKACEDDDFGFGMLAAGCVSENDFFRTVLLNGLKENERLGVNPMKYGAIASTDTHLTNAGDAKEATWRGHIFQEYDPMNRLQPGFLPSGIDGNPGGLVGIWAIENSRDALFDAMKAKEVFGTSGPRITPRFFAGWDLDAGLCSDPAMLGKAYGQGVPMGGDLPPRTTGSPRFLASALRDPAADATPLQRLQIIKGWIDADGAKHSVVMDVAGSGDNGAGVDVATGNRYGDGADSFCTVFEDPDFDPTQPAYYYLRVVENPSPRWSLTQCLAIPTADRPETCNDPNRPVVIQELAWSSPIWYQPE